MTLIQGDVYEKEKTFLNIFFTASIDFSEVLLVIVLLVG